MPDRFSVPRSNCVCRSRASCVYSSLFVASTFVAGWLGQTEACVRIDQLNLTEFDGGMRDALARLRDDHGVSLLCFLPIILTTAFVIFTAWRRAVRDAEVGAVGEGE